MSDDDAYDMGYTDGHQDGAREAWLIATPIIHRLRAALEPFACGCRRQWTESCVQTEVQPNDCTRFVARAALDWRTSGALDALIEEDGKLIFETPTASAAEDTDDC